MRPNLLVLGLLTAAAGCNPDHPPPRAAAPMVPLVGLPAVSSVYGLDLTTLPERPAGAALAVGGEEHALVLQRAAPSPMIPVVMPPVPAVGPSPAAASTAQQVLAVEAAYRRWCVFADSPSDQPLLASMGGVRLPGAVACARSEASPPGPPHPLVPAASRPSPLGRRRRMLRACRSRRTGYVTTDPSSVNALQEGDFSLLRRQGQNLRDGRDFWVFWGCPGRRCSILHHIVARFRQVVSRRKRVISPSCDFFGHRCRERFFALQEGEIILLRRALVTVACLAGILTSAPAFAADLPSGTRFLGRGAQGWFWYERMPEPPAPPTSPEPAPSVAASPPQPPAEASSEPSPIPPPPLSAAWFRAELEHYRDAAVDNPTPTNVRAYLYLQKVMLDKADGFARVSGEVAASDPYLDATTERPLAPFASQAASAEATSRRAVVLRELSATSGILFIVERSCNVCLRQADVLQSVQRQYGFSLLTVSLDGAGSAGLQLPVRRDSGQAARLGVVGTPALYLMRPPDVILPLAQGALDQDTLLERIVAQAHRAGWIDDATYAATRPVRQPFATPDPGSLDADHLADPVQLVANLRATLGLPDPAGAAP